MSADDALCFLVKSDSETCAPGLDQIRTKYSYFYIKVSDHFSYLFFIMDGIVVYPLRGTQLVTEIWRLTSWILLLGPS